MLLSIRSLSVTFPTPHGPFRALRDIELNVREEDSLAVVGESGCGKSVLGYAVMRLLDDVAFVSGSMEIMGRDAYRMESSELRSIRGRIVSLVPQSPSLAFNPVISIGEQIREFIEKTGIERRQGARQRALDFLKRVGFSDPSAIYDAYPHRLSGGMCEMALIAMAVSTEPKLIIADEPTKGLDAVSRKRILTVLRTMADRAALILVTHDMRAASTCGRVAVMYSGEIVEEGPASEVLELPLHVYTRGLLEAHPSRSMKPIRGSDSGLDERVLGCGFRTRCEGADQQCQDHPALRDLGGGRKVRCHHA
jgi:peptide/nickel transport system ATP-binding protein